MSILETLNVLIDDLELFLEKKGLIDEFAEFRRTTKTMKVIKETKNGGTKNETNNLS